MSRIGRKEIVLPAGVSITTADDGLVTVSGPKGTLTRRIENKNITVSVKDGKITLSRSDDANENKSAHGLYRSLIANMVQGVVTPFTKKLIINGVGFSATVTNKDLVMDLGFSHPVIVKAVDGIEFSVPSATEIVVTGIDKELVGQIAADIRATKPVEPYHAYGVRYATEVVVHKVGKTAAAAATTAKK
jgi:large subunit ribosomal protein L6